MGNEVPASYPHYLPVLQIEKSGPLEPFDYYEHGKDADPSFPDLLTEDAQVEDLTPKFGSEVRGIQLSKLTNEGKDQLALFVAQRKVVAFRNQDFAQMRIDEALNYGGYFGRHLVHPTSAAPPGYPEIHIVHRGPEEKTCANALSQRTSAVYWHSDLSFEEQPPGTTFLYVLDGPPSGGDTIFADMVQAYNRLSPEFRKRLHGLNAEHTSIEHIKNEGGNSRRPSITVKHPIVRTHPATGEKALFVNNIMTKRICGYKKEESDFLLRFLFDQAALSHDLQIRLRWKPGTVVVYDNRVTAHAALFDFEDGYRRHLARLTPQAERPYETPFEG
ncbi:alpha-ketoglutarate-dependent taurine dioxygenase [Aspergillus caelatus]|uniref:Alpha-ketoglutarate-dependent taurine dioxygenase n=2 Tax=Aspergillus subgen. Circumdati TaxID=2720871 RepID=A0A5N7AJZ2_9EURO|nr:alpha-ketoglutarate-dependent taurine dioxygenase [Aspergillus caelatus]KAE8370181.1 alpha-ketoglutarate-dependent taurine dioxygenase [Aspergillus caelatus]KAE8420928.1 alpha-ketoglutarate-dependent taurine dioxygenase [Aspergillus pseudocaelatus]